jgi:DNA-binding SARP family transcriptional activator/energy-coupling factor transporter ATP-binding protein EcfA2
VRYRVLGPLEVEDAAGPVRLGGRKEQAVLAQLLARVNSAVPADRIAFGLWEDSPPASAARTLQAYVARLRRALQSAADGQQDRIVTVANGWTLRADPGEVDALRFESLVRSGRAALDASRFVDAGRTLSEALEMWRGQAYGGFDEVADCRAEAMRLTELRLLAQDERLAALLGAGDADRVAAETEGLLAAEPLRERRWCLLIHALYASGRQADALTAYTRVVDVLREEMGVEPGPELQRLHARVLAHDPRLLTLAGRPVELPPAFLAGGPLFVGRDRDLAYLAERWSSAVAGCGEVLLLAGNTGVGKSRLVAELARRAAADAGDVVDATPDDWDPGRSLREVLAASRALWPATGATRGLARSTALVGRSESPRLIVVDAAQRLPPAAAAALAEVHRGLVDRAIMVVVAYRDDEATEGAEVLASLDLPRMHIDRLADAEIAAIARSYRAPRFEIDVGRVVAESVGLPQRAHHLAGRAAALAASRRVSNAAGRARKGYHGMSALRDELTASVRSAQRLRRHAALYAAVEPTPYRAPYKGLAAFDLDDAGVFFGREAVVADLMARLAVEDALVVVGPSGSGKSSFVRAGLLAALRQGGLPGSDQWSIEVVTPGTGWRSPPASGPPRLLVVDQLEELFTVVPAGRAAELIRELTVETRSAKVVATLRSDFYPDAVADPDLGPILEKGTALLRQMRPDELRRAITEPVRVLGFEVADDLVDSVLTDVSGQPGALPLLSVALEETFRRRTGRVLERAAYESTGGVAGALARLAEEAYQPLDAAQRTAARRVLLRLSEEDNGRLVRRRAAIAELCPPGEHSARAAIEVLAARRLVVVGDGTVEVGHEALLSAWERCRTWLADDAAGRQVRTHLTAAASAWQAGGRSDADLYRGARLVAAMDWAAGHGDDATALEREYLESSQAAVERQRRAAEARAAHEARQSRRLRVLLGAVAVLLVISLAAAGQAIRSAKQAREHATAADAARLGSQALTESRIDLAALLAAQAMAIHPSAETRAELFATLLRHPEVRRVTSPLGNRL